MGIKSLCHQLVKYRWIYKILNLTDFSVFNYQYLVFFGIPNTDVGIGNVFYILNIG